MLACLIGLGIMYAAAAQESERDERTFADAGAVLADLLARPESGLSRELLQEAHGLMVVPNTVRAGFFLGGRRGRGILVLRTASGEWSNPAFVVLTGGSIGWQIGAQSADVVLAFMSERAAQRLAGGRITLGGDIGVTAGYSGSQASGAVRPAADVRAFAISRGLFLGATFEGTRLALDAERNRSYYGDEKLALASQELPAPNAARRFLLSLIELEAARAPTRADGLSSDEATLYPLGP
jgi:lipid-binding SYLF domain-containing protein